MARKHRLLLGSTATPKAKRSDAVPTLPSAVKNLSAR